MQETCSLHFHLISLSSCENNVWNLEKPVGAKGCNRPWHSKTIPCEILPAACPGRICSVAHCTLSWHFASAAPCTCRVLAVGGAASETCSTGGVGWSRGDVFQSVDSIHLMKPPKWGEGWVLCRHRPAQLGAALIDAPAHPSISTAAASAVWCPWGISSLCLKSLCFVSTPGFLITLSEKRDWEVKHNWPGNLKHFSQALLISDPQPNPWL